MNTLLLSKLNKIATQKIGKLPIVILPLEDFEKMKEDLEMYQSKALKNDVAKARAEIKKGKILTLNDVKRKLMLK